MDALFININTTGSNPGFCRLTSIITANLDNPPYNCRVDDIGSLEEERIALTKLCGSVKNRLLVYNNSKTISFISEVCSQYSLEFIPSGLAALSDCLGELKIDREAIIASIPKYEGELKHFYRNYRDYYYLPAEDTAYHKSVARFVDKSARVQAIARTAYTKKTGIFIPVLGDVKVNPEFIFQESYRSLPLYTLPRYLDLNDPQVIASYMFCPHTHKDS